MLPGQGQVDYAAANAVLDRLARRRQQNHSGLSCALSWGAWRDVGMAWDFSGTDIATASRFEEKIGLDLEEVSHSITHPILQSYRRYADGDSLFADPEHFGAQFHMLFPNIGWAGMAYNWSSFHAIPVAVDRTIVESRARVMPGAVEAMKRSFEFKGRFNRKGDAPISLADLGTHPVESGDSMLEDMWACAQVHKAMKSPAFQVGALARRFESMITVHQQNLMDFVNYE